MESLMDTRTRLTIGENMADEITIRGARLHNLKNLNVAIPKNKLVVFTGVSGSGKSTLGFDILLKEGQRLYMESLGMLPFGMAVPPVESICGLSPTISVDQHLTNRSPRSTVGTVTLIYTYLRVLFARLGHRPCPNCGQDIPPNYSGVQAEVMLASESDEPDEPEQYFPCPHCGTLVPVLTMRHFSFNKPAGACPTCTGLGTTLQANLNRIVDERMSVSQGAVTGWNEVFIQYQVNVLRAAAEYYGFSFDPDQPIGGYTQQQRDLLFFGVESPLFRRHFPAIDPPATVRKGKFEGIAAAVLRRYREHIQDENYTGKMEGLVLTGPCPDCGGTRLRLESRQITVNGQNIVAVSRRSLIDLRIWLRDLRNSLRAVEIHLVDPIFTDLDVRLERLIEVGVGYLSLNRSAPSLSAGEAQRLHLTSLLGSGLTGVLYIFDEPTIGLHPRDTRRLIGFLNRLRDLGNTVLVIEHDLEMIAAADTVIDFGPGAGQHGGQIVASGTPAEIAINPDSITGAYLSGRQSIAVPKQRRHPGEDGITIRGAKQNNLKNITVQLPLGLLIAVTGVSGSGKSSLIFDTLAGYIFEGSDNSKPASLVQAESIEGLDRIQKAITIDQEHIGRIPRSNAATYTDTFSAIRSVFAGLEESRSRGFTTRHFSFNVPGGRCERCQGSGVLTVEMHFLPDVEVRCPVCQGRRFADKTLAIKYRGCDISQVLDMTIEEALALFSDVPAAQSRLQVLTDVGLGYLQLGQPATTLSGGEAQRIKLAKELGQRSASNTLYLLDEPTTGLHLADIARLLSILQRLVNAGSTVVAVEHNLEVIKAADWVIDLGPEGGADGGEIIAAGSPEYIARTPGSITGESLARVLAG